MNLNSHFQFYFQIQFIGFMIKMYLVFELIILLFNQLKFYKLKELQNVRLFFQESKTFIFHYRYHFRGFCVQSKIAYGIFDAEFIFL
ncbi:unnamed protein product [Paramecium sonneborni]|uniref:Transmembrane protein n=1 Tax=Paramecium sonneborni TaxID=65129 RepID=A0A8S1L6A3_9CILI|nr:unnamed protein product [Paramecium sonneborni]